MSPLKNVSSQNPRQIALEILRRRHPGGEFTENLLEHALAPSGISSVDRALCQELVYGVVRWQAPLDWLVARKTDGRKQIPVLQNLLRLGLYQIFWLDRVPDHAAVHETVELAKHLGFGPQAGFVNALLRGYVRERDATRQLLADLKRTDPALGCSHPGWLVGRWRQQWGPDAATQLMAWNNTPPKTFARVNMLKADPAQLLPQWRDEDVEYDFVRRDWFEENLVFELKSHPPLASLPSFQQGRFYIQDPSTLLAVHELEPKPGETILDLCAAPGGKLTFIAQLLRNEGRVVAEDVSAERLDLVAQNCARLGVTCVECRPTAAAPAGPAAPAPQFDRVLVDAPCSNTGVMRRRVDLRWRIQPREIGRICKVQRNLLRQAALQLKPGGVLVYSTCSLEPEENQEIVKAFLAEHGDFKLDSEQELLPFVDAVDGAYVARLTRLT
jgi:16S rRNA (cytosine967-C5)-methyltransferase